MPKFYKHISFRRCDIIYYIGKTDREIINLRSFFTDLFTD